MNKPYLLTIVLILGLIASFAALLSCSKRTAQCPLCERDIHTGMQVKITHNHLAMQTCCMACALTFQAQKTNVEIKTATDFLSNTPVEASNAYYVVGSDVSPCMHDPKVQKYIRESHAAMTMCYDRCSPGILAFRTRTDAEKFQKENGGSLSDFKQLPSFIAVKRGHHHD